MHKQFRFGNSNGIIINDLTKKNKIIDFLFNNINLSKYIYNILNNIQRLNFLKQNEHYVSPNYKGYNYYLLFLNIDKNNYCVAIDKRRLSYHRNQINIKDTLIIKVKVLVSNSIFRGTIFDCKLIKKDYKYLMLIKDCYLLMGNKILDMELKNKMIHLNSIITNQFNKSDNFSFKINKLYDYNNLEKLINNIIPKCSIPCQGIIFYPKFSGITIVYLERKKEIIGIENDIKRVENTTYNMIYNLTDFLKSRSYSYENDGKKKRLWLKKTEITDVYDIHENLDSERLGIAHIPNLKISHMCQDLITGDPIRFLCVYNKNFKKWIPIKKT